MNASMKQKQLELNVDKSCFIIFDKRSKSKATREAVNNGGLLTIGQNMIKAKPQDKYLGDILNEGGLAQSVKEMINADMEKLSTQLRK